MSSVSNLELYDEWAGIADAFLESAGFGDDPTDPWDLAACYDLRVAHGGSRACTSVVGDVVRIDTSLEPFRQRADLAHELAHVAMEIHGYPFLHDEAAASWIGAALLCPTRCFKRDVKTFGWDLDALRRRYAVSWELAARRIADVRSAVVTIVDRGRVSARVQSPWLHEDWGDAPTAFEQALVASAIEHREHVRPEPRLGAFFVRGADGWERVIVVAATEELQEVVAA